MSEPNILGPDGVSPLHQPFLITSADMFILSSDFNMVTGRGSITMVLPGGQRLTMHPNEARLLGMRLITEGEAAVGQAIAMRIMLEIMSIKPEQAVQILVNVSAGTRADHTMAFERDMLARLATAKEAQAMGADPEGKVS